MKKHLSKTEKRKLLEDADTYKWLTRGQLAKLIWWEWFNRKKIDIFYHSLYLGKAAIFAYNDALKEK